MDQLHEQLYDIYTTWHIPWWQHPYVRYAACALVIVVIVGLVAWAIRARMRRAKILTPWQRAQASLGTLQQTIATQDPKIWYAQLSEIVKQYIYERYARDVRSETDEELLVTLHTLVAPELLPAFTDLVHAAVGAKFANALAVREQQQRDLALCVTFVKNTVPLNDKH